MFSSAFIFFYSVAQVLRFISSFLGFTNLEDNECVNGEHECFSDTFLRVSVNVHSSR